MFGFSGDEMKDIIDGVELAPAIIENADNWSSDEENNAESSTPAEKMEVDVENVEPQPGTSHTEGARSCNMVSDFVLNTCLLSPTL